MSHLSDFYKGLSVVLKEDRRYHEEAYLFVMASLSRAMKGLEKPRHVTGQELLKAIQEEAEGQFGPMSREVFHYWGIKNSLDFGRIVFNMVQQGILSKTETDSIEDFKDNAFFQNLFDEVLGYRLDESEMMESNQWQTKQ